MSGPARSPGVRGVARIRWVGAATLTAMALLVWQGAPWTDRLQSAWFDAHQVLAPRPVRLLPVTVVAIDPRSLAVLGQWPWPRNVLAQLIDLVRDADPAAIGINLLLPEADALSPERVLALAGIEPALVNQALRDTLPNDQRLAQALARAPVALAVAGMPDRTGTASRTVPFSVHNLGSDRDAPALITYGGLLTSLPMLHAQASGWGLISVDSTRGIFRRVPLVGNVDGTLVPTLAIEMLRVAQGAASLRLDVDHARPSLLRVGALRVPMEADGAVRVYFSPHRQDRFISASDLLQGRVDSAVLQRQLVVIGLIGTGLADALDTPLGQRMSGSEIHAQLLENLVDGTLLNRPRWAPAAEATLLLAVGGWLVWGVPRWRIGTAVAVVLAGITAPVVAGFVAFRSGLLLLDVASPGLSLLLLFGLLTVLSLSDATRQRRALQRQVQAQRERSARLTGELEAGQRIQNGSLPAADLLSADGRVEMHAVLTPAREVGGDLYDYFMLDEHRLFLLIGDVAGKGLSASIFMAVSRALYKSTMLRAPQADIGEIMGLANAEVSRDNAQSLFVSAFAAVIDLRSGALSYCNAGHDNPYRLHPSRTEPTRIEDGDGPPLCAIDDYAYVGGQTQLLPGELLCLITDGVTEARNTAGELYGSQRLHQLLTELNARGPGTKELVSTVFASVQDFAAGADAADDLTILALRWRGA